MDANLRNDTLVGAQPGGGLPAATLLQIEIKRRRFFRHDDVKRPTAFFFLLLSRYQPLNSADDC